MKTRYFLRGLGLGMILTAVILCARYRVGQSGDNVVEQAKALGMVFPEGTKPPAATEEPEASPSPTAEPEVSGTPAATAEAIGGRTEGTGAGVTGDETPVSGKGDLADTKKNPAKTSKKTTDAQKSEPSPQADGETVKFTIRSGLLSSTVATGMKEAGIIKDDKAFDRYLVKCGDAKRIRAGEYHIPIGASYEEIAKIITRQ